MERPPRRRFYSASGTHGILQRIDFPAEGSRFSAIGGRNQRQFTAIIRRVPLKGPPISVRADICTLPQNRGERARHRQFLAALAHTKIDQAFQAPGILAMKRADDAVQEGLDRIGQFDLFGKIQRNFQREGVCGRRLRKIKRGYAVSCAAERFPVLLRTVWLVTVQRNATPLCHQRQSRKTGLCGGQGQALVNVCVFSFPDAILPARRGLIRQGRERDSMGGTVCERRSSQIVEKHIF